MKLSEIETFMKDLNKGLREQSVSETLIINPTAAAHYTLAYFSGLWRTTKTRLDFGRDLTVFCVNPPEDGSGFATLHIFHANQSNVSETELAWNEVAFNFPHARWCYLEQLVPMNIHISAFEQFGICEGENPSQSC